MFELITRACSRYDSGGRWILGDLNLHLYAGKRYGIAGGNGQANPSLIGLMAGIIHANQRSRSAIASLALWSNHVYGTDM